MKKPLVCIVVLLLFIVPFYGFGEGGTQYTRKDPILAGALSWYVPGLGQFYSGAFLKGAVFWVAEEALLISTILTLAEMELNVTGDIGITLNITSKENPNRTERRTAFLLGAALVGVHFYNIIDAVNTTRNYNLQQRNLYADVVYDETGEKYGVTLNKRF